MTSDERFDRIEHHTARLAEQFRKDWEENRLLWLDTQRAADQELRGRVDGLVSAIGELIRARNS